MLYPVSNFKISFYCRETIKLKIATEMLKQRKIFTGTSKIVIIKFNEMSKTYDTNTAKFLKFVDCHC